MKKWIGVLCVCIAGCGDSAEPASVADQGAVLPQRDMGNPVRIDMNLPGQDMAQPIVDQGEAEDQSALTDQGQPSDQGAQDLGGQDDLGIIDDMGQDAGDVDQGVDQGADMSEPVDMAPMCGNNILEPGELCDGDCPASCDDGNACTDDSQAGSAQSCDLVCVNQDNNSACGADDGCCPSGCTELDDVDCTIDCRDPATWPAAWTQREDDLIAEVNARRALGGNCGPAADMMHMPTPPLVLSDELREAGRCHALDMATRDYFASRSPEDESVLDRTGQAGYMGAVTVGQGITTRENVVELIDNWLGRPGNCNHILNARYDDIGVGYVESSASMYPRYWTQVVADKP